MNKDNGNFKLIGGLLVGMLIGGATVVAANQAIRALQNTEIKISLNGQVQTFKDETTGEVQYPLTYHDRTYLPLRNVAQLAGLSVDYDTSSNTAILKGNSNKLIVTSPYGTKSRKEREYTTYKNNYLVSLIREHYNDSGVQSQLVIEEVPGLKKHEFSVAMNNETDEFLYEIKNDEIFVTEYIPFPDAEKRPDYAYKLFRVDYKITEYYGTFKEEIISIDLGDTKLSRNRIPTESEIKSSLEILNNYKDRIKDSSEWFTLNSVHATIPAVPGAYVGEFYYFDDDGTYYWGASEYYNDQEYVASTGTWSKENDKLILNASHMLFLKGGKLVPQSNPNGLSKNELIDYKETIVWGPSVETYELNFVKQYDIDELNLHEYEYLMNGETWYSNTKFNMDDNPWIRRLKELKENYKFLGGYSYAIENEQDTGYNIYVNFENIEDFSIIGSYEGENICTIKGTYKTNNNIITCNFNNFTMESTGEKYDLKDSEMVLEYNDLGLKVIDWKYKSDEFSYSYGHAYFATDFVNIGDVFHLIST
jgi:hypothetical protein